MLGFSFQTLLLKSFFLGGKALFGSLRLFRLQIQALQLGFFDAIILHQRDMAWAYPGTGSTLYTIIQVIFTGLFMLACLTVPVELLWQEIDRAGISTLATTDAVTLLITGLQLAVTGGHDAIADLYNGHIGMGQGKAHHGATHYDALAWFGFELILS